MSVRTIGRSSGGSATGAAAYRAGEKIRDHNSGLIHDYTQRTGVYDTQIIAPDDAPSWAVDRSELWNRVERAERRKDAQLAREYLVAIPHELNDKDRQRLVSGFAKAELVAKGMITDIGYHDFDSHNPHAHILTTTRSIDSQGFGLKNRDWNRKSLLLNIRQAWAVHANQALEQAGLSERIDHRSLKDQGILRIPQVHLGRAVIEMEKKGIRTELGDQYRAIEKANEALKALELNPASTSRQDWTLQPNDQRYLQLRQYALNDYQGTSESLENLIAERELELEEYRYSSPQDQTKIDRTQEAINNANAALEYLQNDAEVQAARLRQQEAEKRRKLELRQAKAAKAQKHRERDWEMER